MPPESFGQKFKAILREARHTQQHAAELLKRTPQYIWMVANDRARPGKDFVADFTKIYNLHLETWLEWAGHSEEVKVPRGPLDEPGIRELVQETAKKTAEEVTARLGGSAHSGRLREILGEPHGVLGGLEPNEVVKRIEARTHRVLTPSAISQLKQGLFSYLSTVRVVARAYADTLLERHRAEIEERLALPSGSARREHAEDWLAWVAEYAAGPDDEIRDWLVEEARQQARRGISNVRPGRISETPEFDDWTERAERKPEFAAAFSRILSSRSEEEIRDKFWLDWERDALLSGAVPPPQRLFWCCTVADFSAEESDALYAAAGYGGWRPHEAYSDLLAKYAEGERSIEILDVVTPPPGLEGMSPRNVREATSSLMYDYWEQTQHHNRYSHSALEDAFLRSKKNVEETLHDEIATLERASVKALEGLEYRWRLVLGNFWRKYEAYIAWCVQHQLRPLNPSSILLGAEPFPIETLLNISDVEASDQIDEYISDLKQWSTTPWPSGHTLDEAECE